ncbi:MAG: hypothetical protein A2X19_09125 [Bacteroidetes bacterium GWE2_39_28]|nr:MAG: hypothetical protein A2X19_09125 [Bacteroidetes bacterium GWE2_39_28]OFY12132.1 MAG: hypothetical protein A2X16_06170 [Bacteroidetes bacterium GWF2_39_10]OFZ07598.1 MAG: hypothetical protein A2322_02025 [Bacteroidetes bacterium RIFOXYB2_FULL_39_7]OFZ10375.1 MAG: hypothetical protein A2465_02945 [Bacteroidetes bacterium RIFOXYC2_FULL_39_11]HCT94157.1 hypothetical protein [Rikenellaceae bacterium]
MILQPDKSRQTERAWDRLYNRLERDGLLSEVNEKKQKTGFNPGLVLKFAASLIIIAGATIYLYIGVFDSGRQMLSLHNPDTSSTYVKTLADGSVVYLSGNSTLSYPDEFKKVSREVFLNGEAYFEISKIYKSGFKIETDLVNIEVLGTSFNVKSSKENVSSISVNTGEVRVTHKNGGQSFNAVAGETIVITSDSLEKILTEDLEMFISYSRRMHFKDEPLQNVVDVLNRNINSLEFEIVSGIEQRSITATFSKDSPDSVAELIALALNLRYLKEGNKITIYELP